MEKDYALQVAGTIKDQLVATTPKNIILSWGVKEFIAVLYKGMAALRFHVDGRLFSGNVIVVYTGSDSYEVYLQNYSGTECIHKEAYFDELGRVIDQAVGQAGT